MEADVPGDVYVLARGLEEERLGVVVVESADAVS